ncbi:hypothetical protein ACVWZ3_010228 [Bradyrhizobium sp. i1.3.6]
MEMDLAERFFLGLAFIGASCLCVVFLRLDAYLKFWPASVNRPPDLLFRTQRPAVARALDEPPHALPPAG